MFLKQLYKHSRWMFVLVVFFIAAQLFINYKRGMVVSPFYHYGMYSEVIKPKADYAVFEVWANGKQLQGRDFTPWQWEKIILPLVYYSSTPKSNQLYHDEVKRLMNKFGFNPNEQRFLSACNYRRFEAWYKDYLGPIINQPVNSLDLKYRTYQFTAGILQPTKNIQLLPDLCR